VAKLAAITRLLAGERASLAEALDSIPLAADNVVNAYDSTNRTLDGRGDLNELSMGPGAHDLQAITPGGTGAGGSGPAGAVPLSPSSVRAVPPLPLPAVGLYSTPEAVRPGGR
jgi:hypothetical protein